MGEARISVGVPPLPYDQAPEVVRRYAVRAGELGFAGLWSPAMTSGT